MTKNKLILLTGCAGFIGYWTTKQLLKQGYSVLGIDNFNSYYSPQLKRDRVKKLMKYPEFTLHEVDLTHFDVLNKIIKGKKIDSICHLAAQAGVRHSISHPFDYTHNNIHGFLCILELARHNKIKNVIYASSSSVYGNNSMPLDGFSEKDHVDNPISLYAATKKANELMAYTYHHLYGLNLTGLRFFTVYGPWGRPDMALFKFTKSILEGQPIEVYNNGNMRRNFTYVDDIVSGIIAAIEKAHPYEVINLGNAKAEKLMDFVHEIENALGMKADVKFLPMQPGDVKETFANLDHAREALGFQPKTNMKDGIRKFIKWYSRYYK